MKKIHRYNIVSGILLILFIIDFALAAPVLVQEKRQASVDVVHMPRDVVTVLGKRMDEDFNEFSRLVEEHFKIFRKPVESSSSAPPGADHGSTKVVQALVPDRALSDAHASSSSAPPGLDHGSKNEVQEPAPNPPSSSTNPSPLMEPSSPSSSASSEATLSDSDNDLEWMYELDEKLGAYPHQPNTKKRPWTDLDLDPDFNRNYRMNFMNRLPPRPGSRPVGGWTDVSQPLPSIPEEPSPVSSPDHAPPSPGDGSNQPWVFGHPESHFSAKPESSSAVRPSSSSPPSGPADGSTDIEQPLPSTPEESSSVPSPDHAPPNPRSLTEVRI